MKRIYSKWMERWENQLCFRSNNRVVRPFEWGLDWTGQWPVQQRATRNGHGPSEWLKLLNGLAIEHSDEFFGYDVPGDFRLEGDLATWTSPVDTPYGENNLVRARYFPAKRVGKAVVVLPHWNSHAAQHVALCRALQKLGLSAIRLSLPYHDERMPPELQRADYAVSANIARTIDATRQAIVDTRCAIDFLAAQGHTRFGIVGTSLGSCYAFLASAHDPRLTVNVFNHCSGFFADVVWTGLSTRHIREGIEKDIDLETLRDVWRAISPVSYMPRFARWPKQSKFVYASYDTTFLPELSRDVIQVIASHGIDHEVVVLPCGHYTLGETPYKFLDGYHICSFLKTRL